MKSLKLLFIIALSILSIQGYAQTCAVPGTLYAMTGAASTSSSLYTMNPVTGATTLIGSTGLNNLTAMAIHPITGDIYAARSSSNELYQINSATGAATLIGAIGTGNIPDMSFDNSGNLYAWTEGGDDLVSVNITTGAGTIITSVINTFYTGLAFDSSDNLYLKTDQIHQITTGGAELSSVPSFSGGQSNILTFDGSDVAYTLQRTGGGFDLYTIDVATGNPTLVVTGGLGDISALDFCRTPPPPATIANDDANGDGTPDIADPCDCTDPLNPDPAVFLGPGGGEIFHELVTVTSGASETWTMDATTIGALDATGAALTLPATMTEISPGVYTLDFYHEINVGYAGDFSNLASSTLSIGNTCTLSCAAVPTLGEWGLIIFTLLLLNTAIFFVVRRRKEVVMG